MPLFCYKTLLVNAPDKDGNTPIHEATFGGHTEIVKILASLTDNNLNAPNKKGETPIYWAAEKGHTEIVKFLSSLTIKPNAPDYNGQTPIYLAALNGYTEIVRILTESQNPRKRYKKMPNATPIKKKKTECNIMVRKNISFLK